MRFKVVKFVCFAVFSSMVLTAPVLADEYPSKPIKIVVPYTAGGGTDQFLRAIAPDVSEKLGTQIIIDNRPGASTTIGAKAVIGAKPDGYTLLLTTNGSFSLVPYTLQPQPYDPQAGFDYIGVIGETALVLVTGLDGPKSFKEFIESARKVPGEFSYATSGVGNASHMAAELLQKEADLSMLLVPFKGVEGSVAVAAGHVLVGLDGESAAGPLVDGGRLRPLAVLQQRRSPTLPDTPSLGELGYPESGLTGLTLLLASPKGTPEEIRNKVHKAFAETLGDPDIQERLKSVRTAPVFLGPKETQEYIQNQTNAYEGVFRENEVVFKNNGLEFIR